MDCFDREFLEIFGNDIADEKEKPELLNEGMIQISSKPINQKENDSELDAYIKEAFSVDDEYDELPEEEDDDFDTLSDEEIELADDEYEPELEDEEELLTEKTNESKNNVSKEKVNEAKLNPMDFTPKKIISSFVSFGDMEFYVLQNDNGTWRCGYKDGKATIKTIMDNLPNMKAAVKECLDYFLDTSYMVDYTYGTVKEILSTDVHYHTNTDDAKYLKSLINKELKRLQNFNNDELYERENNNNFIAESFNANPSLPETDKKLLVFWGYEPKDFPQIELAMQKATFEDENANLLSAKEAEKYLGHKEFLSGLARCAFHGSAVRYPNNDESKPSIYFDFDLAKV